MARKKAIDTTAITEAAEAAAEAAVAGIQQAKATYGLKTILIGLVVALLAISLAVTGYSHWSLSRQYAELEQAHRESLVSAKQEQAKAIEAERAKVIAEYQKKIDQLLNERLKKRAEWKKKEAVLADPDRGKVLKNEVDKLDPDSVARYFAERGYKPKLGAGGGGPTSP